MIKGSKQPDPEMTQLVELWETNLLKDLVEKMNSMHKQMENLHRNMDTTKKKGVMKMLEINSKISPQNQK